MNISDITPDDIKAIIRLDMVISKEHMWLAKNHRRRASILNKYLPQEEKLELDPNQLELKFDE